MGAHMMTQWLQACWIPFDWMAEVIKRMTWLMCCHEALDGTTHVSWRFCKRLCLFMLAQCTRNSSASLLCAGCKERAWLCPLAC